MNTQQPPVTSACPSCQTPLTLDGPGDYGCPSCGIQFRWPAPVKAAEPARVVKQEQWLGWPMVLGFIGAGPFFGGAIFFLMALNGVSAPGRVGSDAMLFAFLAMVPMIFGAFCFSWGNKLAKKYHCSECGNKVEKTSRLCPTCKANFG